MVQSENPLSASLMLTVTAVTLDTVPVASENGNVTLDGGTETAPGAVTEAGSLLATTSRQPDAELGVPSVPVH